MTAERIVRYAPGKLLLFGEHAAVYGHPAIGVALDRGLTVSYTAGNRWALSFTDASGGAPEGNMDFSRFFAHLESVVNLAPGALEVHMGIPIRGGFGSSAALCTAIASIAAVEATVNADIATVDIATVDTAATDTATTDTPTTDIQRTWSIAHQLERFFHGTPSGIDTGLSTIGGVQAFFFDLPPGQLPPGHLPRAVSCQVPGFHLVVGSIPRTTDTRTLVDQVRFRRERNREDTDRLLSRLGDNTRAITTDSVTITPVQLGELATAAHADLVQLGVSNAELDSILAAGRRAGATGGKLSGAGGGGAFYLVCSCRERAATVEKVVRGLLPPGGTSFTMAMPRAK